MPRRRVRAALAAASAFTAVGVARPVSGAHAATPRQLPPFPALPALGGATALPGLGWGTFGFQGPQVAIGPTVIGSVFNGGTSGIVSNDPPVNSGNVIGSP
jgi:hypothetical protein